MKSPDANLFPFVKIRGIRGETNPRWLWNRRHFHPPEAIALAAGVFFDPSSQVPQITPALPSSRCPARTPPAGRAAFPSPPPNSPKRRLTNLYNERSAWLAHAHATLDAAVATAYGWPDDLTNEEILARLLELNRGAGILPDACEKPVGIRIHAEPPVGGTLPA